MTFRLFVPGVPAPQGSKSQGTKKNGKPFMYEDNARTKPWRKVMVEAMQEHGRALTVFDSAVWVSLRFVFLRPKSHKPNSLPTSKLLGDVDKLTRNVLDALTQAGVITDDKFVVKLRDVEKVYGPNPGVHIEIGAAVPNPFGEGIASPLRFAVDAAALESWEPSPEALMAHRLEEYDQEQFWRAVCGDAPNPGAEVPGPGGPTGPADV